MGYIDNPWDMLKEVKCSDEVKCVVFKRNRLNYQVGTLNAFIGIFAYINAKYAFGLKRIPWTQAAT
jgi:hypothetical protein